MSPVAFFSCCVRNPDISALRTKEKRKKDFKEKHTADLKVPHFKGVSSHTGQFYT